MERNANEINSRVEQNGGELEAKWSDVTLKRGAIYGGKIVED